MATGFYLDKALFLGWFLMCAATSETFYDLSKKQHFYEESVAYPFVQVTPSKKGYMSSQRKNYVISLHDDLWMILVYPD